MTYPAGTPQIIDRFPGRPECRPLERYEVITWSEPNHIGSQIGTLHGSFYTRSEAEACAANPPPKIWDSSDPTESIQAYVYDALMARINDLIECAKTKSDGQQLHKVSREEYEHNVEEILREAEYAVERLARTDFGLAIDWIEDSEP